MRKKQEKYYFLRLKRGMRGGKIILKQVKNERKYLEKQLKKVRKEMDVLPGGKLRCTSSNGSDQYFIDGRYISKKKKDYAQKVAQQEYDTKLIRALERVISKWKEIEFIYDNRILEKQFDEMCGARKRLVKPWIEPIDMKIKSFMEMEYVEKNMRKLDIYERNGYLLGEKLLLTHETSKAPLSRSVLDSYIESYLL